MNKDVGEIIEWLEWEVCEFEKVGVGYEDKFDVV